MSLGGASNQNMHVQLNYVAGAMTVVNAQNCNVIVDTCNSNVTVTAGINVNLNINNITFNFRYRGPS